MKPVRDIAELSQGHALLKGWAKCLLGFGVVERCIEPSRPLLLERDLRLDFVPDVESRRQARLQGTLAQQASRKAVQRLNGCLVEVIHPAPAPLTLHPVHDWDRR